MEHIFPTPTDQYMCNWEKYIQLRLQNSCVIQNDDRPRSFSYISPKFQPNHRSISVTQQPPKKLTLAMRLLAMGPPMLPSPMKPTFLGPLQKDLASRSEITVACFRLLENAITRKAIFALPLDILIDITC